jgi:hypothetical protein
MICNGIRKKVFKMLEYIFLVIFLSALGENACLGNPKGVAI